MSKEILQDIIDNFAPDKFSRFFRDKNRSFAPRQEDVQHYDDENFRNGLKLGEIKFSDTEKLIACTFQVKQLLSERSGKKAQYEKGKKILKDTQSDAGIFIFYDQTGNFRFSLIYPETIGNRRQWSSFRRFTYFVSREFTNKTFFQRIGDNEFSSIEKIKDAFSVEKVTKEFYLEYRKLFESLVKDLSSNHTFINEAAKNDINTENFAKKLLGQIVFIYFIQKKGWMGVPAGQNWGAGDKNFLINQFKEAIAKKSNFFNDYLESLFYGILNNPRRNSADPSFSKEFNCRIPFLNGGLFEAEYNWKNSFIYLDNNIFSNIFGVFERFNFTVEEESPDDKEIAVDPEMLGKVFENLLSENLRKGTGTYYTPREVVYYMCQESLVNYLDSNSKLNKNKVEKCVKSLKEGDKIISDKEAIEIDNLLENMKICDPACGSGAFLVGMLNEIVRLRLLLRVLYPNKLSKKSEYQLKKDTIHNCIYGVDIDPGAIEIAKLRLWLALVVDYEIRDIEPLPNLDYRLMCGNSLLEEFEGVRFYNGDDEKQDIELFKDTKKQEKIAELKKKVEEYFDIHDDEEKRSKRKEINDIKDWLIKTALEKRKKELASHRKSEEANLNMFDEENRKKYFSNWGTKFLAEAKINEVLRNLHDPRKAKPFFIWKLEFIDVFEDKGGFDTVIANPPYVQIKGIPEGERRIYEEQYKFAIGRFNLFYLFIERCEMILRKKGSASFIVPDRLLLNTQCKSMRTWLLNENKISGLVSFADQVFETAVVDSILIFFERDQRKPEFICARRKVKQRDINNAQTLLIPVSYFELSPSSQFDLNYSTTKYDLLKKITTHSIPLGDISDTKDGIIQSKIGDILFLSKKEHADCRKLLVGEDVTRYGMNYANRWVDYRPAEMMKIEKKRKGSGLRLRERSIFERPKILTRQTADEIIATYDEKNFYYANTLHGTAVLNEAYHPYFVLAVLNSKITTWYYRSNTDEEGKVFAQIKIELLRKLPIPNTGKNEQRPFVQIVTKILATKERTPAADLSALENEIDQMVYKLYGLTKEEVEVIEGSLAT